jgi:5,10-methylene-tetrahydrofolate dehydrogenase/methenyl tetrahydrofolate cyclohydrolase
VTQKTTRFRFEKRLLGVRTARAGTATRTEADQLRRAAMALSFEGQRCVVTGGGRGMGKEYALLLAARGAKVVVNK